DDIPKLKAMGAGAIFGPGTPTKECIRWLEEAVGAKRSTTGKA
ncbi:MAG: Cobalamin B12-binding domain protein, partial [Synergistales bacterium 53_16]